MEMVNHMLAFCPKCGERYERRGIGPVETGGHSCPPVAELNVELNNGDGRDGGS